MKNSRLCDIADYVSERISVDSLTLYNYISTENMLSDKAGIAIASGLPTVDKVLAYQPMDTLTSNIRPYFHKIWYADRTGGCSNDVLAIRAKEGICPRFLYYVLSDDVFFNYSVANSKGTKMPRGDKKAIMLYKVPSLSYEQQRAIAATLSCLDDKIEVNNKINANLEAQAQAIFKSWFVDFEPFQDGEFVDSELGPIPKGWRMGILDEIIEIHDSKRVPLSSRQREKMQKIYPYYGAATLMDYVDDYLFNGVYVLLGEDGTVVTDKGYPVLQYVWGKFWVNNHAHILKGANGFSEESLYILLKNTSVQGIVTGAVQAKISQTNLKSIRVVIPEMSVIESYNDIISPMFAYKRKTEEQSRALAALRDALLPKLMNGELSVADLSNAK